jgi:hypothetical protein
VPRSTTEAGSTTIIFGHIHAKRDKWGAGRGLLWDRTWVVGDRRSGREPAWRRGRRRGDPGRGQRVRRLQPDGPVRRPGGRGCRGRPGRRLRRGLCSGRGRRVPVGRRAVSRRRRADGRRGHRIGRRGGRCRARGSSRCRHGWRGGDPVTAAFRDRERDARPGEDQYCGGGGGGRPEADLLQPRVDRALELAPLAHDKARYQDDQRFSWETAGQHA